MLGSCVLSIFDVYTCYFINPVMCALNKCSKWGTCAYIYLGVRNKNISNIKDLIISRKTQTSILTIIKNKIISKIETSLEFSWVQLQTFFSVKNYWERGFFLHNAPNTMTKLEYPSFEFKFKTQRGQLVLKMIQRRLHQDYIQEKFPTTPKKGYNTL